MKIKIFNWTVNFSAHPEKLGFWWTKQHEIRLANSTTAERDENGKITITREFFTARALIYGAYYLAQKRVYEYRNELKVKLTQPEFVLRLAIPLALLWVTRIPLMVFGVIEYQSDTDDNVSNANPSYSHTTPSGSERLLVVASMSNSSRNVTAMAYGGNSLTLLANVTSPGENRNIRYGYLINPSTGAATVGLTLNSTSSSLCVSNAVSFTGARQSDVVDGSQVGTGSVQGGSGSISKTTSENGVICLAAYAGWAGNSNPNGTGNLTQLLSHWTGSEGSLTQYTYQETAAQVTATVGVTGGFSFSVINGFRSATPPVAVNSNFFGLF